MQSRYRILGLCLTAVFALSAMTTASAWASGKPFVETKPATKVGETTATLNGVVNPNGATTKYYFEYGTTIAYGSKTTEGSAGSGISNLNESSAISGLIVGRTYHYRVVATNANGTSDGADVIVYEYPSQPPYTFVHCAAKTGGKFAAGCGKWGTGYEKEAVPAGSKTGFTITSGVTTLKGTGNTMTCQKNKSKGEVTGAKTVANVKLTLEECKFEKGSETCEAKTPGSGKGVMQFNALNGELGKVSTTESTTGVGEVLKPASGEPFFETEGTCVVKSRLEGAVIGEVTLINEFKTTGELVYACYTATVQEIEKFEPGSFEVLKSFAVPGSSDCLKTNETVTFAEAIEVT